MSGDMFIFRLLYYYFYTVIVEKISVNQVSPPLVLRRVFPLPLCSLFVCVCGLLSRLFANFAAFIHPHSRIQSINHHQQYSYAATAPHPLPVCPFHCRVTVPAFVFFGLPLSWFSSLVHPSASPRSGSKFDLLHTLPAHFTVFLVPWIHMKITIYFHKLLICL